jgi:hypothetical protein
MVGQEILETTCYGWLDSNFGDLGGTGVKICNAPFGGLDVLQLFVFIDKRSAIVGGGFEKSVFVNLGAEFATGGIVHIFGAVVCVFCYEGGEIFFIAEQNG